MPTHIELLLTENVDNLGIVGDVVKVKPGFARNFLLPRNMATKPTDSNVKRLAARRAQVEAELKAHREQIEALFEKVKDHELTMQRSANEQGILFGGVSQHDIAQAMRDEGFPIEERMVRLGQQIKRLDSYHVPLVLASDLKTEIKLWIVSDKPSGQRDEAEPAAQETEQEEKPKAEGKKKRKTETEDEAAEPKKAKAEKHEKAEEPAAEEKPKKKGKKKAEDAEAK